MGLVAHGLWPSAIQQNVVSGCPEEPDVEDCDVAKLNFGLQQCLDGYVDHLELGPPGPAVFRHFIEHMRDVAGCVYGRRTYEIMRYWDDDMPEWDAQDREFAAAWRSRPKWVVSRSLQSVGPNTTLVQNEVVNVLRGLKARLVGEIDLAGPSLARSLGELGLVDEYRLYLRPTVLGHGTPSFAGPGHYCALWQAIRFAKALSGTMRLPATAV